jgi:hypothetical protein
LPSDSKSPSYDRKRFKPVSALWCPSCPRAN